MTALMNAVETQTTAHGAGLVLKRVLLDQRRAALHLATFVAASVTLFGAGYADIASGSAFFWLMAAWVRPA